MTYKEEIRDLFITPADYYLAHCISADFRMGAGIAVEFNNRLNMKERLQKKHPRYLKTWINHGYQGDCILEGCVLNLITKERYYHKPTYNSLRISLERMCSICIAEDIKKIAMPMIASGLDKLEWPQVSEIIQDVFKDSDVEILVCKWK